MIGHRTLYSLAQLLEQQEPDLVTVLIDKHCEKGLSVLGRTSLEIVESLAVLDSRTMLEIINEIVRTSGDLRTRVSPKYRFDERFYDLKQCLLLDGYGIQGQRLMQTDPSIDDAPPIDDDLILALQRYGAERVSDIITKISDSAHAFRKNPPDYNAALVNVRVALETLAEQVATDVDALAAVPNQAQSFDPTKWGDILRFLRQSGEITLDEELGLAGVFRFVSPGAHRPIGIPEEQMTRLGRSLALHMCWFLLQNRLIRRTEQK